MPDITSAIRPLPDEVAAQIKSSTTITTLESVILELVKNALDASARRVDVDVDWSRGVCTVEDDGLGISPDEFREQGGLGKVFHTSKQHGSNDIHGGEGTFLASLSAISLLMITSHHHAHRSSSTLIYHHAKPTARLVPAPNHHQLSNREHGTKIQVHDLFGNMPVRVKQRGSEMASDKGHIRQWEVLRRNVVGLLLAWQSPVNVVIRHQAASKKLVLRSRSIGSEENGTGFKVSTPIDLSWICSVLAQAGYTEHDAYQDWIKASARTPFITIRGAFSLQPTPSKRGQFISLGIRQVDTEVTGNVLYEEINRTFAHSSFGNLEESSDDEHERSRKRKDRRYKKDGHTNKQLRGAGKGVDRWPMFVIRIELQEHRSQASGRRDALENEATLSSIVKVLGAMTTGFLSDHGFRPRKQRKRSRPGVSNGISSSPGADPHSSARDGSVRTRSSSHLSPGGKMLRSRSSGSRTKDVMSFNGDALKNGVQIPRMQTDRSQYSHEGFTAWSRIKSGTQRSIEDGFLDKSKPASSTREEHGNRRGDLNTNTPESQSKVASTIPTYPAPPAESTIPGTKDYSCGSNGTARGSGLQAFGEEQESEGTISWIHPVTKAPLVINARTGQVVNPSLQHSFHAADVSVNRNQLQMTTKFDLNRLTSRTLTPGTPKPGSWVSEFLKTWENPVFKPAKEPAIPQVSFREPSREEYDASHGKYRRCAHVDIDRAFSKVSSGASARLSKAGLHHAKVISQVDKKFVLALMDAFSPNDSPTPESSSSRQRILVLIDQHAADERIRVESFFAELCAKPLPETSAVTYGSNQIPAVATTLLPKALHLQIKSNEQQLFETHAQHFADWGIMYNLTSPVIRVGSTSRESAVLVITALPPVIAERCRLEPKVLINLLRKEIWHLDEHGTQKTQQALPPTSQPQASSGKESGDNDCLHRITSCPQGIIDMLNSRACRSAIMFNDELDRSECEVLVRRLAGCRVPFQCAHGRPSMVPLGVVGALGEAAEGGGIE
ncbi:MAG: hypothetical protein Q9174_002202, partial [Haloplaca sp. 1 TL-2023]